MKRIGSMLLALTFAVFGGSALAGAPEGSWYVAPSVNALWLDDDRLADDDAGVTLAFGRTLSTNWDAQISFFGSEHDRSGGDNLELQGFGLNINRVFYREGRVNPFLTFGLGRVRSILKPGADQSGLSALYGAGLLIDLGEPRVCERARALELVEYRRDDVVRETASAELARQLAAAVLAPREKLEGDARAGGLVEYPLRVRLRAPHSRRRRQCGGLARPSR